LREDHPLRCGGGVAGQLPRLRTKDCPLCKGQSFVQRTVLGIQRESSYIRSTSFPEVSMTEQLTADQPTPAFTLTDTMRAVQEAARSFAEKEIRPVVMKH